MKSPHILLINKNVVELRRELAHILDKKSGRAFDKDIRENVSQLFALGTEHLDFAKSLAPIRWRQIISRTYYGAYNASRAVRLAVRGHYSQESKDHERVGELPDDFTDKNLYANRFRTLRDDRNLCDYDHTAIAGDLAISPADAISLVDAFTRHARVYLKVRAFKV
ncbi:MAG TPA: hypothetical protein VFE23_01695 [Usitatibacter sp.]|nr:hypothetical protein [Usitatibacter sp.]